MAEQKPAPADDQREHTITRLREAVGTGHLSLEQFDQRATQVYQATTLQQLRAVVADLPTPSPPSGKSGYQPALRPEWLAWLGAGLINLVVWAAVSAGAGELLYFWPIWVIGPWGLLLLGRAVMGPWRLAAAQTG